MEHCQPCSEQAKISIALHYCVECEEYLCEHCTTAHRTMKATKNHNLIDAKTAKDVMSSSQVPAEKLISGKPIATKAQHDSVTLVWDSTKDLGPNDYYQLSYKDLSKEQRWKTIQGEYTDRTATVTNLKSEGTFVFRVRVVYEDGSEGLHSPQSDEIKTTTSLARKLVHQSTKVKEAETITTIYKLPLKENVSARNAQQKTRKFEIGHHRGNYTESKNIMLVGATGTGKSTFVDGIVNFCLGVTWDDPFRFTVESLEMEEKEHRKNQALSQTEWITCYKIYPETGSRLEYELNIIDTPGFGDVRGLKRDKEIIEQIRQLFSDTGARGINTIDAVCFLIKAPDARLTPTQSYIFQSIMSLFGKDIAENICSLITFADGSDPPVYAALNTSKLPFGKRFTFNNSALFAPNLSVQSGNLSPMFWDMGLSSFKAFFTHLLTMEAKSLQLTKDVLLERVRLEALVRNLQETIEVGVGTLSTLKNDKAVLERHKFDIEDSKDFEYEELEQQQIKTKIEGEITNTKCKNCFFRCHEHCAYEDNEDKKHCWAMDSNGFCRICPDKCHWRAHFNDAYKYEHVMVKVTKTSVHLKQKYQEAKGKASSHSQLVAKNQERLVDITEIIEDMMSLVKSSNERLQEIALRPNPLSMTNHIDILIENEKQTQKPGYMERIKVLHEFRAAAEINKRFDTFIRDVNVAIGTHVALNQKPKDVKSLIVRITTWLKKSIPGFSN